MHYDIRGYKDIRTGYKDLQHYGIRCPSHQLIKSFLERKQFVSINGVNSDLQRNSFGVPLGSTLGPLLFLIYIND